MAHEVAVFVSELLLVDEREAMDYCWGVSRLDAAKRSLLPDRAFAYIDGKGRRRLPIHDESHVRNALARFNQVKFEDEAARERARARLLNAAKKYGIVPIGFFSGQLRYEQREGKARAALPTGFVTLMMTDIERSTVLLRQLRRRYGDLLDGVRGILRASVSRAHGREIEARADEFFAVFERASDAIAAAVSIQRALAERRRRDSIEVRVRVGIHSGRPTRTDSGYFGLPVHTVARVCGAARGGQIVVSGAARAAVGESVPSGVRFRSLGRHRLRGLARAEALYSAEAGAVPVRLPRSRAPHLRGHVALSSSQDTSVTGTGPRSSRRPR